MLEYGENVDQELLLGDIADISGCRNPAVFMERYFQIDDAHLEKEFQKISIFLYFRRLLSLGFEWNLWCTCAFILQGQSGPLEISKGGVVGSRACSKQGAKSVEKVHSGFWKMNWLSSVD